MAEDQANSGCGSAIDESVQRVIDSGDATLKPMWPYAVFTPTFYIWEATWNQDTLIPLAGLAGAVLLALRSRWQRSLRFVLVVHLTTCVATAASRLHTMARFIFSR